VIPSILRTIAIQLHVAWTGVDINCLNFTAIFTELGNLYSIYRKVTANLQNDAAHPRHDFQSRRTPGFSSRWRSQLHSRRHVVPGVRVPSTQTHSQILTISHQLRPLWRRDHARFRRLDGAAKMDNQQPHLRNQQHLPLMQHTRHARTRLHTHHSRSKHHSCVRILGPHRRPNDCLACILRQQRQRLSHIRQLEGKLVQDRTKRAVRWHD
jgi:hypothetical protein